MSGAILSCKSLSAFYWVSVCFWAQKVHCAHYHASYYTETSESCQIFYFSKSPEMLAIPGFYVIQSFLVCIRNVDCAQKEREDFGEPVQRPKAEKKHRERRKAPLSLYSLGRFSHRPYASPLQSRKKARIVSLSAAARPWIIRGLPPPRPWIPALTARPFFRRSVSRLPMT